MAVVLDTPNTRLYSPTEVFGGRFKHDCMGRCGNTMVVPDAFTDGVRTKLEDGDIWGCIKCGATHEYYMVRLPGVRTACVRLHEGIQRREAGEPTVGEFVGPELVAG